MVETIWVRYGLTRIPSALTIEMPGVVHALVYNIGGRKMVGDDLGEIWFNTDTERIDNQDRESQVSYTRSYTILDTHTFVAVKYNAVLYYRPFEISSEWERGPVCRNCKLYVHTTILRSRRHQHPPEGSSHK